MNEDENNPITNHTCLHLVYGRGCFIWSRKWRSEHFSCRKRNSLKQKVSLRNNQNTLQQYTTALMSPSVLKPVFHKHLLLICRLVAAYFGCYGCTKNKRTTLVTASHKSQMNSSVILMFWFLLQITESLVSMRFCYRPVHTLIFYSFRFFYICILIFLESIFIKYLWRPSICSIFKFFKRCFNTVFSLVCEKSGYVWREGHLFY